MSYLDGVPFRTAKSLEGDPAGQNTFIEAPAINLPDCTDILVSTMHDFSLERKVLYWLEAASQHQTSRHRLTADTVPTAPPCWLLLVDPAEGRETAGGRARDGAVRRCISLNAADQGRGRASDTESEAARPEEDGYLEDDEYSSTSWEENDRDENVFRRRNQHVFQQIRPKTSPGLLEPPPENGYKAASLDTGKQRRSLVLFNNMKNELEAARRKLAALVHPLNRATAESGGVPEPPALTQRSRNNRSLKYGPAAAVSCAGGLVPAPPPGPAAPMPPIRKHKPTVPSLSPYTCLPPARPLASRKTKPDSAADLLAALSQEERDLIEPVIALGYPARKAILTLQKTGRQSLGQFLGYLRACDRLLKQGYEEGQVEEAMEMFQYSEKKAAEFLHLLAQFNDMGFQQNEIKEVLLLCGNQRDKALEELMMKRQ
ncbi:ubiquitin-associated protein 1-like [Oxyura jamaicensis]|uniref:ubiquitin-associated protein 1-like n=1 Tax=Oxyura jamaicensis TaxID=8884 RepID=UPI0015A72779|nr:ubiquitin-associated protein 1-like [Oxyura jamaicensis]